VKTDLNQNQRDALASLIYNIGGGNFRRSRLRRAIQRDAPEEKIRELWMQWDRADGVSLKGIEERREEEADLFFKDPTRTFFADHKGIIAVLLALVLIYILYRHG
jgi:lysozyme